jgi:hypothetical protein
VLPVLRRCPFGHVLRDTRRGLRRNGSGARRAAGPREWSQRPVCVNPSVCQEWNESSTGRKPPSEGDSQPRRASGRRRCMALSLIQRDRTMSIACRRLSPASRASGTTSFVAGGEGRGLDGPRPAAACC